MLGSGWLSELASEMVSVLVSVPTLLEMEVLGFVKVVMVLMSEMVSGLVAVEV